MKCIKNHEVEILKSAAGYYLGTVDPDDHMPYCRISKEYAKTEKEAKKLLMNRQTSCIENNFCNGGRGCFKCG